MRGIDISHYDGWPFKADTAEAYKESDFVIVKATQGVRYSKESYFAPAIEKVLADGKLAGAYHYAAGLDPKQEADYFLSTVEPYIGRIVLALDWEEDYNRAWGSRTWAKEFVEYVLERTGVLCFVYTGMDGLDDCGALVNISPLWFAGYPRDRNSWDIPKWPSYYRTDPWKGYTIWQFTSGDDKLDRNVTSISASKWTAMATPKKEEPGRKTYSGKYPVLPERGYFRVGDGMGAYTSYATQVKRVQTLVNWITGGVIAVDGKFGEKTKNEVKKAQSILGVVVDGLFGSKTLKAAKKYNR